MTLQHIDTAIQLIVFCSRSASHDLRTPRRPSPRGDPTARMLGRITLSPHQTHRSGGNDLAARSCLVFSCPGDRVGQAYAWWTRETSRIPCSTRFHLRGGAHQQLCRRHRGFADSGSDKTGIAYGAADLVAGFSTESDSFLVPLCLLLYEVMVINVVLGVFNLIPVPTFWMAATSCVICCLPSFSK